MPNPLLELFIFSLTIVELQKQAVDHLTEVAVCNL